MQRKPLHEFEEMMDRMGRQFEQARMSMGGEIATAAVDVGEWDGEFVVEADMPGFERKDIDVRITDHTLIIEAEHKAEREEREELDYIQRERVKTDVKRTIRLPEDIDAENVAATYENGVLSVTLPKKKAEAGSRKVEIS